MYFGIYSSVKEFLHQRGPFLAPHFHLFNVALAAAIGNTFASVFRDPYEVQLIPNNESPNLTIIQSQVLKQRVQAGQFPSAWEALLQSLRLDGPFGLFDAGLTIVLDLSKS